MKTYFSLSLFFLTVLCKFIFIFAEEYPLSPSSADPTLQNSQDLPPENSGMEMEEVPPLWHDRLEKESDTFQTKFFHMLFILGLLIAFMILASWALKRMMRTKITQLNTANSIKVLETRYLSPRATLYLVEAENRTFLIAESPTTVTYLASLPSESASEEGHFPSSNLQ